MIVSSIGSRCCLLIDKQQSSVWPISLSHVGLVNRFAEDGEAGYTDRRTH
jgi:hypothetical protein